MRRRRRAPALATAAVAAAAGVGLAVAAAVPGGSPASNGHTRAALAAWTVTREHDGRVTVTVREVEDPAGLQRKLAAEGVPADVTFRNMRVKPGPVPMPGPGKCDASQNAVQQAPELHEGEAVFYIVPSAIPKGGEISLYIVETHPLTGPGTLWSLAAVVSTPACPWPAP